MHEAVRIVTGAARAVLDTNVCLDLFVFDDPRLGALRSALETGAVTAYTDPPCRAEWQRVLAYPQLGLDAARYDAAMAAFDRVIRRAGTSPSAAGVSLPLPRCADPDDQKFLDLARACQAQWILTRDDHLLALSRRTRREGLFEILTPQAWQERFAPRPPAPLHSSNR